MIRTQELLIILAILLLLFGSSKLPGLGASLGSAIRNFKKGFGGEDEKKQSPPPEVAALGSSSRPESPEKAKSSERSSV